jgi:hypothetical protein
MCAPDENELEKMTHQISEEIRKKSVYKVCEFIYFRNYNVGNENGLVSKVILEEDGLIYEVKPNENGLKFSVGDITYNEYKKIKKKETHRMFSIFSGAISFLLVVFGFISWYWI